MNLRMSLLSGAMVLALSVPAAAQYQTTPAQPATPGTVTQLAPGAVAPGMMASTQAHLNLRAGPGAEHATIGAIPQGATVEVQECLPGWCEVTYAGMTGFASQAYLASDVAAAPPASAAPPAAAALAPPTFDEELAQATSHLNLRAGPGLGQSPIGVIPEGATVEILDCLPDRVWCEVSYAGMTGYASELYLETAMDLDGAMDFDFTMEPAPGTAAALAPPAVDEGIAFAMTDLNLRAGAGMEHPPIAVIPEGASVMIHDCLPGRVWCEVSYGEVTGFASQRYLEIS